MFLLEVKYWRLGNVLRLIAQKRSGWSLTVGGGRGESFLLRDSFTQRSRSNRSLKTLAGESFYCVFLEL